MTEKMTREEALEAKVLELEERDKEKDAFINRLVEQRVAEDEGEIGKLKRSLDDNRIYFKGFKEGVYFTVNGVLPRGKHADEDDH